MAEAKHQDNGARKSKRWFPLESNPSIMTTYVRKLGLQPNVAFHDVFGTDDELLALVPTPVHGVIMLFPITEASEKAREADQKRIERDGQLVSDQVFFTKQTVSNACGTVGIMHLILNTRDKLSFEPNSWFLRFLERAAPLSPDARAQLLEEDTDIEDAHDESAHQGQSELQALETPLCTHFVAFVERDGMLYELDGRRSSPVNRGPTSPATLLQDAVRVIRDEYMAKDPNEVRFTITALGPALD